MLLEIKVLCSPRNLGVKGEIFTLGQKGNPYLVCTRKLFRLYQDIPQCLNRFVFCVWPSDSLDDHVLPAWPGLLCKHYRRQEEVVVYTQFTAQQCQTPQSSSRVHRSAQPPVWASGYAFALAVNWLPPHPPPTASTGKSPAVPQLLSHSYLR